MPDFTCKLKQYRQARGLTQEQLAALVGVRRETIMRLEKAQYNPSLKLAVDISRAVGATCTRAWSRNIFNMERGESLSTSSPVMPLHSSGR